MRLQDENLPPVCLLSIVQIQIPLAFAETHRYSKNAQPRK